MKLRRVALALVVLASLAHGQDTRPGGQDSRSRGTAGDRFETLAGGSAEDRLAALLWLEDSRSGSRPSWKRLFEWDDPAMRARILRGLGRTAEPDLKRALIDILTKESYALTTSEMQRAAALAVGLFGDPELLPMLAGKATPRDVAFAAGLMKMPLATALDFGTNAESRPDFDQSTFTDPVEAALRWGAVIDPPPFAELARKTLEAKDASEPRRRAAVDYFARSKAKAPADLRPALTELLRAGDPELEGLAARALAKSQGAGDAEAAAIEAAFLMTTSKVAQVDQVRALAALPVSKAFEALGHMLVLSRKEPAVLRTVLESLKAVASKLPDETRKVVAATLRPIVQPEDGETRAPADVEAAAVSLLAAADQKQFFAMLPALRLAARWQIRAAAGAALASQPEPDLNLLERFLRDPDRRTRIDVIEALAGRSSPLPAPVLEQIFHLLVKWWESYGGTGTPQHCFPLTHDPVEIAVIAKLMSATEYPAGAVYARTVLGESDLYSVIPDHEVEALQSVLDLAGATGADKRSSMLPLMPTSLPNERVLRRYLRSPEISLRKRAKDLLKKNGIEAQEETPPRAPNPGERLSACVARAKWMLQNPLPLAVIETSRGPITIKLFTSDCPATVENFLKLAKSGFYEGILWHRVVPAFVAQAGCPRGDGWGGAGYTIRCEVNDRTYRRGSVGMALAGKDTGGCQFFICHRALPHLDGRYTLFAEVIDGMDVVDQLGQEDVILKVREM